MSGTRGQAAAPTVLAAVALYALFYFGLLDLPPVGVALFRIDYVMTTVARGNELQDVYTALYHARPVSELTVMALSWAGRVLAGGEVRYFTFALQHLSIFAYFFMVAHTLSHVFRARLHALAVLAAWLVFIQCQGLLESVYKLESLVGTVSMLFGGLSLVLMVRWDRLRTRGTALAAVLAFAASVFAKEDFLMPPLLLMAWLAYRDGLPQARRWIPLAAALSAVLVAFLVFNRVILPGRSFIEAMPDPASRYYMTFAPATMLRVLWNYTAGRGPQVFFLAALWSLVSFAALVLRVRWKETLWLGLVVGGLLGPYLIMPNHQFSLYAVKWLPWQALGAIYLLHAIATERFGRRQFATLASITIALGLSGFTLYRIGTNADLLYHQGKSLNANYAKAIRLRESLLRERDALNRLPEVAVLGVGPNRMLLSPWHNTGETDFFFTDDLGLRTRWIVYTTPGESYMEGTLPGRHVVEVRDVRDIQQAPPAHAFVVDAQGNGRLVDTRSQDLATLVRTADGPVFERWTADSASRIDVAPRTLQACPGARSVVRVTWDVARSVKSQVQAYVVDGDNRTLWSTAPAVATQDTGAWASSGMRVELVPLGTPTVVAQVTIGATPCKR